MKRIGGKIEERAAFIQGRAEGRPLRVLAAELGRSKSTLEAWEKELEAKIRERKGEELEAVLDRYRLARAARLAKIGAILEKIDAEIEARGIEEVQTGSLLYLRLQYSAAAAKEADTLEEDGGGELRGAGSFLRALERSEKETAAANAPEKEEKPGSAKRKKRARPGSAGSHTQTKPGRRAPKGKI